MSTVRLRCLAMVLAIASGFSFGVPRSWGAQAASSVVVFPVTDQGVAVPVPPAASSGSPAATAGGHAHGARRAPDTSTSGSTGPSQAPTVRESSARPASRLVQNFDGVGSLDSEVTNFGAKFEPPDQGLCEGNGFVIEPVNSAYRVYRTDGTSIAGPFNVNDLFDEGGLEFTSDPRCHFDPTTNTWFAEILFISADNRSSREDIAINASGDPTTPWTQYRIDTTDGKGQGCPCFGDQPRIGIDQFNVYISTDEFSIVGKQFNGPQIYAISKSDLVSGAPAHFAHFGNNIRLGSTSPVAVEPALSAGTPDAEYFLNAFDPHFTSDHRIGVWAMTDRAGVASGHAPTLSATIIASETYGRPLGAPQKGASSLLDGGDDRMQQTQFISGSIWGELTTGVAISGDTAPRDGAAWFEVTPTLNGNLIGGAAVAAQGYVAVPGSYLIYPALQVDSSGRAAMAFTQTDSSRFPSADYAVLSAGAAQFGAPIVAAAGSGPYDPLATRWGDYSWAVLDPATDRFWMATEYMPPASSQTTTGQRNWGTRVLEVSVT